MGYERNYRFSVRVDACSREDAIAEFKRVLAEFEAGSWKRLDWSFSGGADSEITIYDDARPLSDGERISCLEKSMAEIETRFERLRGVVNPDIRFPLFTVTAAWKCAHCESLNVSDVVDCSNCGCPGRPLWGT